MTGTTGESVGLKTTLDAAIGARPLNRMAELKEADHKAEQRPNGYGHNKHRQENPAENGNDCAASYEAKTQKEQENSVTKRSADKFDLRYTFIPGRARKTRTTMPTKALPSRERCSAFSAGVGFH